MIGYLQGTVLDYRTDGCLLLTPGGVGYVVHVPASVLNAMPARGERAELHVHTVVREDAIDLYGFATKRQQETFVLLVSVSKLGPKTALAMLSTFDPDNLGTIIRREDYQSLTRVPGIGQKSAKRIVWELKDRFAETAAFGAGTGEAAEQPSSTYSDALAGLLNLGYHESEARPVLNEILGSEPDLMVGEAIRAALKRLSGGRGRE
jgi:Holliday junction DNA helicase RuvA